MITKRKILPVVLVLSLLAFNYGRTNKGGALVKEAAKGIAVVELFTSEGCSSCPPADKLLSKIAGENKDVYVLSYHVDYWDHLGWKDPFSQSLFTERQRQYAKQFKLESIYTPQVVVNGAEEFVGSDEQRLRTSLLRSTTLPSFPLNVVRKSAATINISYDLKSEKSMQLHVAIVQLTADNKINRGENRGRTLHHVNVVRQLKTVKVPSAKGSVEMSVHASLQDKAIEILLFTQTEKDNRITAASKVLLPHYEESKGNKQFGSKTGTQ